MPYGYTTLVQSATLTAIVFAQLPDSKNSKAFIENLSLIFTLSIIHTLRRSFSFDRQTSSTGSFKVSKFYNFVVL